MGQRLVLDEIHHRRDRDAVVSSEGRPIGREPITVDDELDPPLGGVVRTIRLPLAHHVQVPLEHDGRCGLASRGRRHVEDEVARRVLAHFVPTRLAPGADVVDHRLLVPRWTRDRRELLEVLPERARFDAAQHGCVRRHKAR